MSEASTASAPRGVRQARWATGLARRGAAFGRFNPAGRARRTPRASASQLGSESRTASVRPRRLRIRRTADTSCRRHRKRTRKSARGRRHRTPGRRSTLGREPVRLAKSARPLVAPREPKAPPLADIEAEAPGRGAACRGAVLELVDLAVDRPSFAVALRERPTAAARVPAGPHGFHSRKIDL